MHLMIFGNNQILPVWNLNYERARPTVQQFKSNLTSMEFKPKLDQAKLVWAEIKSYQYGI